MSDRWTDDLSDYLDGDLPEADVRALERHLESCDDCRVTLDQLRHVRDRARALADPPAPDDLWAGIASRIGPAGSASVSRSATARVLHIRTRPIEWAWPRALAAGIALLLVSAGALWLTQRALQPRTGTVVAGRIASPAPDTGASAEMASFDPTEVEGEIAKLQRALDAGRGRLDPKTIVVLEKNLKLIRQATEDAKRALAQDPANRDLQDYFAETVNGKLALMRRATAMAGV